MDEWTTSLDCSVDVPKTQREITKCGLSMFTAFTKYLILGFDFHLVLTQDG